MKFISNWLQRGSSLPPGKPLRGGGLMVGFGGSMSTASGQTVNAESALTVSAVYACIRVLAESIASLPLILYQRTDSGKRRAVDHPLYRVLHDRPNRWQTSFEWREMMMAHVLLRGNAYSRIVSTRGKAVAELVPLHPDRVRPFWFLGSDGQEHICYLYTKLTGEREYLLADEMHHWRGMSGDGLEGLSPITLQREAIGLSLATQEHGARLFSNGAQIGGFIKHPKKLSNEAFERLEKSLKEKYTGGENAHKTMILEEDMEYARIGMTADESQFLETRQFQVSEIARIFRVPPHMIGDLSKATFGNIEQQSLDFVIHSLRPWLVRIEQAMVRDLLSDKESAEYFLEFLVDGLLRGDFKSRTEGYRTAIASGWMSPNEAREKENMDRVDGLDRYLAPLNMVPFDKLDEYLANKGQMHPSETKEIDDEPASKTE